MRETYLKTVLDEIKKERVKTYQILSLSLDVERSDEPFFISGNYLYVLELDGVLSLKFNEISNDSISLQKYRTIKTPYYRMFISHPPQIGKTVKLALGVETEYFEVSDFGTSVTQALIEESTGVILANVTCLLANTEYSYALGQVRKFTVKPRNGELKLCFMAGESATTYLTLLQGQAYWEDLIKHPNLTLYFQSPTAGTVVEIVRWL